MYGFYKSSYTDENGVVKYLATTQFQPTFARRVFPSFDEPAFKATFEVYLTYPIGLNALSNMPGEVHDTSDIVYDDPYVCLVYKIIYFLSCFLQELSYQLFPLYWDNVHIFGSLYCLGLYLFSR